MDRLLLRFEGWVQGVGFRMSVTDLARNFDVTGRVWNVLDGSVRVVAEGESSVLLEFQAAIHTRMKRNIVNDTATWATTDQRQWSDFGIGPDTPS
jgi:acylphosphatase